MSKKLQAVRGMYDILPDATPYWRTIEEACVAAASAYGYREIRFPIVEQTALFKRTIGEETDVVSKEMYTFEDRNGDSLTLRPEGTAGCVRMGIEQSLLYNQIQRFWYSGPMFRHERPQKGRCRQFHQFGIEAFGMSGPDIDAEIIALSYRLFKQLGLQDQIRLEINNLGTLAARATYREALVSYLLEHKSQLDEDSLRRLETNPLRILDSKNPAMHELILKAPSLIDFLDEESLRHFEKLQSLLTVLNIPFEINPHLVRGLDYYGSTVFEWVTDALGAQGTVCAGGRYDVLVEQLGGKPTPAVGFAMGYERMVLLLEEIRDCHFIPDVYFVLCGDAAVEKGLVLAEQLRDKNSQVTIEVDVSGGSLKAQFKRADKSGARWAFVIAEDELANNSVSIKDLREGTEQQALAVDALNEFLKGER
ncbi:MAG: histidine--tRNA ligase [Coxiellaceae bacterium]|nr:histidine--tRNA ligase [Coxiellaceae bacterium]